MKLKTIFPALVTCVMSTATGNASELNDTIKLSLDECLTIALNENPTIKVADMEITRVDYSKKETLGQLFPSIAFGATYNRTLAKQTMFMNMDSFGGGSGGDGSTEDPTPPVTEKKKSNGIKVGLDNSYSMGFSLSMPLIAPQIWKSLRLSDAQILQNLEKARQSRIELINQVKSAYYALLLAEDSYKVILESYDMAKFTADLYQKQESLGAASQYDVLRTQVAVKNVEPELTQAEIAIKQATLQLQVLMGVEANLKLRANTTLSDYEATMYEDLMSIDKTNLNNNSEMRMLNIQSRQLKDALTVQKMSWYPTLALNASYNWTSMSNGSPFKNFQWTPYSMVGLTLSIPIFEGGQRYSRIKQAEVQLNEMKWQSENLTRNITMQVDLSIDNINKNAKQISSCSESVRQAETAHRIMKESFEVGAASYLDLRDAELALTRSRLTYYQSIYNYLVAQSELELLLGSADLSKYSSEK